MKCFSICGRLISAILVLLLLLLNVSTLLAQKPVSVSGTVFNKKSGHAISNADVILMPLRVGAVTDSMGVFLIDNLKPGKYLIRVTHIGYSGYQQEIILKDNVDKVVTVFLVREIKELDEVEIIEIDLYPDIFKQVPYVKTVLLDEQFKETSISDVGEYLRSVPNVSGIRKSGSTVDPVVRGFKYSQLNVQVDHGMKIEGGCPNRMDPAVAHLELEDLRAIEILKGPYAFRYGPTIGGVINMITLKPPIYSAFDVHADVNLGYSSNPAGWRQHLAVYGGNQRINFRISGNNNNHGNYQAGNGETMKSEARKYNVKGQLGFNVTNEHRFLISANRSFGRDILFPALPMDERTDDTYLYSIDYSGSNISNFFEFLKIKLYRSDVTHMMDNKNRSFSDTVVAVSTIKAVNSGGRAEAGLKIGRSELFVGFDYEHVIKDGARVKSAISQPTLPVFTEQIWSNALITNLGSFVEYNASVLWVDFIAAFRVDLNNANSDDRFIEKMGKFIFYNDDNKSQYTNFSFSVGLDGELDEEFSLGLMVGRGVRSPDMIERFIMLLPIGYDKYDYLGNPALLPEKNLEVDLTLRMKEHDFGSLELNGFYSIVTDYITGKIIPPAQQKPLSKDVIGVKQFYNADKAWFRGLELSYLSPKDFNPKVNLTAAYTKGTINSVTRHIFNENNEVIGTEVITNDALSEIPPFEARLLVFYKLLNSKLMPGASLRMVAAQNYVSEAFYEPVTPGFFVAGLTLSYEHNEMLKVTGGVANIFNSLYYEHLNRRIIGSHADFFEPGRNFFVNIIISL